MPANCTQIQRQRRFAELLLVLMSFVWSATLGAQSFTVNCASDQGPFLRRGQGYLYSWWHTRESPLHGNLELKPNSWRIGYWGTWDYELQPMVDQGVEHIQVILTDAFRNRGHTTVGGFSHDYTWHSKSYVETVEGTVQLVNERGWTNVAFDLINEPDAFGIDGVGDWYSEAWVPAFRKIRQLRPQAQIVGPGFFSANLSHLRTFLTKAKADNVVPDILSQHLLDNQNRDVVESYTTQIRALLTEYGLAERPISFNEYINPGHISFVEDVVDALAQAERVKVHSMMHSSWDDSGELPPWNSTGDAACFDGVLSIPAQRERACYWVYKFYGDMAGRLLGYSRSGGWDGIATLDATNQVIRVLLGGAGTSGNVTLTLNNVPAAFGGTVIVKVERVTSNGNDLTPNPSLHAQQEVAVSGGTATIAISSVPARSATMVTILPGGLPQQVAAPAFSPLRGTYWQTTTVTLSSATAGAAIRYTLDGTAPTTASSVYTGPITVPVTTTIRAAAVKAGLRDSEIAAGTFTIRKPDNGLYGEFFANATLVGTPALTRVDPQIAQDYGSGRWDASLPYDNFSARWTGRLRAGTAGSYQIHTVSDDGVRLWLDGVLVIDNWTSHARATNTHTVTLGEGQSCDLRLEYHDLTGEAVMRLMWTPPGGSMANIPTARLFPPTAPAGTNLLVGAGTTWKYLAPASAAGAPVAAWKDPGFNDTAWASGPGRIGWGNDGEITALSGAPMTCYFRKTFNVANPATLAAMLDLAVVRDDGAIVYVNGTEVLRDNLPAGAVTWATPALGGVGDSNERTPARGQVPRSLLVAGENTIAVEIHQRSSSDSDGGFDCWLSNPTNNTPPVVGPVANRTVTPGVRCAPIGFSVTDGELSASLITATATSSNPALIPTNTFIFGGYGRSRTFSFVPATNQTGTAIITLTVSDGMLTVSTNFAVFVVAPPANTAPTIGNVTDKSLLANTMSDEFYFTVGDAQTEPGLLTVTAASSNPALIANSNLFINGTAGWRTVSVKPPLGANGSAVITLTVSDGSLTATDTFTVTVESAPVTSFLYYDFNDGTLQGWTDLTVSNQNNGPRNWALSPPAYPGNTQEGAGAVGINMTSGAQDSAHPTLLLRSPEFTLTGAGDLTLWLAGGNSGPSLAGTDVAALPANSTTTGFQGVALRNKTTGKYVLSAKRSSQSGSFDKLTFTAAQLSTLDPWARYTLDLIDYYQGGWGWVAMDAVTIPGTTEAPTNIPPQLGAISDRTIATNSTTGPISFTVTDDQTPAGSLLVTARSANTNLLPQTAIVMGGSGSNRTVTVTAPPAASGTVLITILASDGFLTNSATFLLTIQSAAPPATLISRTAQWRYYDQIADLGSSWRSNAFNDSAWSQGAARLGYGNDGETTQVTSNRLRITTYFRRSINVPDPGIYEYLTLNYQRDDGIVIYVNGAEVWRNNMASGTITYQTLATNTVSGADETNWLSLTLNASVLRAGTNVIAAEVHQVNTNSSDLGFNLELLGQPPTGATPPLRFDFDAGGTLLEYLWSTVSTDGQARCLLAVVPPSVNSPNTTPQAGAGFIGLAIPAFVNPGYTQDSAHDTLWVRSPQFKLNGSGNLTAWLSGGTGSGSLAGTAVGALTPVATSPGFQGIALRNVNTGRFVLSAAKTSSGNGWELVSFTAAQLAVLDQYATYTLELIDAGQGGWGWVNLDSVSVPGVLISNSPPTLSGLTNLVLAEDTASGPLLFTIGDAELAADALTVTAASSNTNLVPNANLIIGGSGSNRTVTVRPATNQTGSATITVTVSDGNLAAGANFLVSVTPVNDPPFISNVPNRTIAAGNNTGAIPFTIGDVDNSLGSLALAASASNTNLVPPGGMVLGGSGGSRTVTITPAPGQTGAVTVTLTVSDGSLTAIDTFVLTVVPTGELLLAEDHFLSGGSPASGEYSAGNLAGQNPVLSGWSTAWTKAGYAQADLQAAPVGLRYGNLATSGGKGSTSDGSRSGHVLAQPFTSATVGTYYLSIVLMLDGLDENRYRCLELHDGGYDDASQRKFQLGQHAGNFSAAGYGARILNNSSLVADLGSADDRANLFVLKFVFTTAPGGDSITIWRNPTNLAGAEPPGGITLSGFDLTFDRLSFASWLNPFGAAYFPLHFDEIRLGGTWSSVTPLAFADDYVVFDFEDGTLQGWTQIKTNSDYSPQFFEVAGGGDAQGGVRSVKQRLADTWPGFADIAHQTLWIRSPAFKLNGAGDLTFWIMGGGTNVLGPPPAGEWAVPTNTVDTLLGGWHGIVLRNALSGQFVLAGNKSGDGGNWGQVTFPAAQLAALDQSAIYTLDAIDARNNAWGWFNFDSIRIPGVLVPPPPPSKALHIRPHPDGTMRLTWPVALTGYRLEWSLTVGGPWEDAEMTGFPVNVNGDWFEAEMMIWAPLQFYRLRAP